MRNLCSVNAVCSHVLWKSDGDDHKSQRVVVRGRESHALVVTLHYAVQQMLEYSLASWSGSR